MTDCRCNDYLGMPQTWSSVEARLAAADAISRTLEPLADNGRTWMSVRRCRSCGRMWAAERPYSELHGGGPELLYAIEVIDPVSWLQDAEPFAYLLRREEEDRRFFNALPPEDGPALCREVACTRKHMRPGAFCRCHHFEMVMRRPCPFWNRVAAG